VSLRSRLIGQVAVVKAVENPEVAIGWIAEALPPGPQQWKVGVAVAQRWAQSDPAGARAWVEQYFDIELRRAALAAIQRVLSESKDTSPAAIP
jgi:hypothetical protein